MDLTDSRALVNSCSIQPLRVALVSTQRTWHGGEEQAALLARGLRSRGHDCDILARVDGEFASRMAAEGFRVHTFKRRGRSPVSIKRIRRCLQSWQPHVLHYNDAHAMTSAGLASLGLPIALRIAARRVDFPLRSVLRYRYLADAMVCVSNAVRQICIDAGVPKDKLYVVSDGVDPTRMEGGDRRRGRQGIGVDQATTLLVTVAKLTDHKGHRFMMEAMVDVLQQRRDTVWAIAGDGPLRSELEAQAQRLGVAHSVRFLGYRNDVADLLAASDLMVVPSHMEGLCSSIVDAMLAGLPVVATQAGGIPDLLGASDELGPATGWLVPPRNGTALAQGVLAAIACQDRTLQQRDAARRRAEREFTARRMVDRTLAVYRDTMAVRVGLAWKYAELA